MNNIKIIFGFILLGGFMAWYFLFRNNLSVGGAHSGSYTGLGLSKWRASQYADRMFNAMSGVGTDTDSLDVIYNEIKDIRYAFRDVSSQFGLRPYAFFGSFGEDNFLSSIGNLIAAENKTLLGWLEAELNSEDFKKWQSIV